MDDWFTIVLAFIFFGLPFLEGILKKSKRRQQGDEVPPGMDHPELPARRGEAGAQIGGGATGDSSWSEDWGSWPGEELDEEIEPEGLPSWSTPAPVERQGSEARASEILRMPREADVRTPDLVTLPEISPLPASQRIQDLAARLDMVGQAETSPRRTPLPASGPLSVQSVARKRRGSAAALLNDRGSVRRAIIVSEVLAPPLALRD